MSAEVYLGGRVRRHNDKGGAYMASKRLMRQTND
jgi:hypothetical protein